MTYPASHFTVLTPLEFIEDVRTEAKQAKRRIFGQAMDVEPGEITNGLLTVFAQGAERQLDVRLHVDHYSLMVTEGTFNYLPQFNRKTKQRLTDRLAKRIAYFEHLEKKGAKVQFINPPTLLDKVFPMRGRNHIKLVVIDDVAWMGGVNFHDENFNVLDSMVKIRDERIVSKLVAIFQQIDNTSPLKDEEIACDEETSILLDGGEVGKSLILSRAVELIEKAATSITLVTPIIPDNPLLNALVAAQKRGVALHCISPAITRMKGIYSVVDKANQLLMALEKKEIPIDFKNYGIHAKILITDDTTVIYGSHNFTKRGVLMGTEEIALRSSNRLFITNLLSFLQTIKA